MTINLMVTDIHGTRVDIDIPDRLLARAALVATQAAPIGGRVYRAPHPKALDEGEPLFPVTAGGISISLSNVVLEGTVLHPLAEATALFAPVQGEPGAFIMVV